MIRTGRPYALAVALLATIFAVTVVWASAPPSPVAATPTNILGTDGRYTLLFLGSDKRCLKQVGKKIIQTERCDTEALTSKIGAKDWTWSPTNDASAGNLAMRVPSDQLGKERTDVIMLLSVDPFSGQTAAYSIPRDLYGFPLKPSLAKAFCRPGSPTFTDKINAMIVRAQQCVRSTMNATQKAAWDKKLAWERSIVAAGLVAENIAWALGVEIDDWTLTTFGTADIMGTMLDQIAPADTIVQLDDRTRFAACRENTLRKYSGGSASMHDRYIASNAKYGDLLYLRPGKVDTLYPSSSTLGWVYANCKEPSTKKTTRTTNPNFVAGSCLLDTPLKDKKSNSSCSFKVPSNLWTGFARSRKYDDVPERALRHQRIVAGITLRLLQQGSEVGPLRAAALASLMDLRWYKKGPPLVRGTIARSDVAAIFHVISYAQPALALGPDVANGWSALMMEGHTDPIAKCTLAGGGMSFAPRKATSATFKAISNCTKAWLAPYFGPVAGHLNEGPPVAP
ncbi:MAG: hypothetical protein WCP88_02740 [bacterium]